MPVLPRSPVSPRSASPRQVQIVRNRTLSRSLLEKRHQVLPKRKLSYETREPKDFGSLPIPVLIHIFRYIAKEDLFRYVSLVCKHWRYAVMQPAFVKSLSVIGSEVPLSYIFDHIRRFQQIRSLYLEDVANPRVILIQVKKFGDGLKRLSLVNYRKLELIVLRTAIHLFPDIEHINLESTFLETCVPKYSMITAFINLKSLNLSKIRNLSMKDILETVLNCTNLEELNIGLLPPMVDLKDDDACLIITNISDNLKTLSIDSRSLTNKTYEKLLNCPKLKNLFLNYAVNLTGEFLLDFWKFLTNIEQLGFSHNCIITGADVHELFTTGADVFYKITYLDFTYCVLLGDKGIEAIAKCCKKLRTMILKSCRSVRNIDLLCKNCKELRLLNIAFCEELQTSFKLPRKLNKLIVNQKENFMQLVTKLRSRNDLKFYLALSEFTDEIERI